MRRAIQKKCTMRITTRSGNTALAKSVPSLVEGDWVVDHKLITPERKAEVSPFLRALTEKCQN